MSSEGKMKRTWLICMFIILPLIMTYGYSNITITKFITMGLVVITGFYSFITLWYVNWVKNGKKNFLNKLCVTDYLVIAFLVVNIITCLLSVNPGYSFIAQNDKKTGLFFVILLFFVYVTIRFEYWHDNEITIWRKCVPAAGLILVISFALFQFMGLDIGLLLGRLMKEERNNFLSTFGNTAVFGKFICIIGIVSAYEFLGEFSSKIEQVILTVSMILLPMGIMASNTDATFLGFLIGAYLLLCVSVREGKLIRYIKCISLQLVGILLFDIIYTLSPGKRVISNIGRTLVNLWPVEIIILVLLLIMILLVLKTDKASSGMSSKKKKAERLRRKISHLMIYFAVIVSIIAVGLLVYFSTAGCNVNLGYMERYLRFNDSWGTERGYVWKWIVEIYSEASFKDKLLGFGQGMVPVVLMQNFENTMKSQLGYLFDNAHNVYLHQMISIGLVGLLAYLSVIISSIVSGMRSNKTYGYTIALIAVIVMDVVSIYEPITTPYVWTLIGIIISISNKRCS